MKSKIDILRNVIVIPHHGCEVCCIQRGRIIPPGGIIAKSKDIIIFHEYTTYIKGYIVVAPTDHKTSLTTEEREMYQDYIEAIIAFMMEKNVAESFTVKECIEDGHIRFHILPDFEGVDWDQYEVSLLSEMGPASLERRGIQTSSPYEILLLVQHLKNEMKKKNRELMVTV
jgi:diadenosine tetraphosphate (Ap4A) HIT family hydrolase